MRGRRSNQIVSNDAIGRAAGDLSGHSSLTSRLFDGSLLQGATERVMGRVAGDEVGWTWEVVNTFAVLNLDLWS